MVRSDNAYLTDRSSALLINSFQDYAIYMLDTGGQVASWNPGARRFKGYEATEIVGQHFSRFYTSDDQASGEPARALNTALTEGKYETEAWRVRKDGSRFFAHVVIDPIFDDDGRHVGFGKVTRDITDRKAAEAELEEAQTALFQAQKLQALGELTGGIAHDFNNLITVIRGSAELLGRDGLSPERRRRYVEAIIETADRAATLTSHLLAFGRRQPLKPEVTDLNVRIDALGEVLGRTLGGPVEVRLDLMPSLWAAEVDATQLETALLNAAFNARDAMPDGGVLILATANVPGEGEADQDMVAVEIRDTGTGMEQEVADRAFEPFFTTKPLGKGTGLGLSQIHGFAAQSGGRAEIRSAPGKGTAIRLLLPRTHKVATSAGGGEGVMSVVRGKSVLLVEDNDHVREFAESLLQELGYRVFSADSVDWALDILAGTPIDIVFSDVVMPGRSGTELAEVVREKWPAVPVVLASGYSELVIGGAPHECTLLQKPYTSDSLNAALVGALSACPDQAG